jgi:hypothetical protein
MKLLLTSSQILFLILSVLFCAPVEMLAQPEKRWDSTPKIISFTANPSRVRKGKSSLLRWKVEGSIKKMYIEYGDPNRRHGDIIEIKDLNSVEAEIYPNKETTYKLVVIDFQGLKKTREVTVRVDEPKPDVKEKEDKRKKKKDKNDIFLDPAKID